MIPRWLKRLFGLDMPKRIARLELTMEHNHGAIDGAVAAFKQFAGDARK